MWLAEMAQKLKMGHSSASICCTVRLKWLSCNKGSALETKLTNYMAYETRRFNAAFTRALQ